MAEKIRILKQFATVWGFFMIVSQASPVFAKHDEAPQVIASIKPLALIAEAIVQGSGIKVEVLLPPGSSPHHYALKVSDAKRLQGADLVIWLGGDAEPYINAQKIRQHLALLDHIRQDQLIQEDDDHDEHHHLVDPHIWLDPVLAQEIATLTEERLSLLYPDQKVLFQKNMQLFRQKTHKTDQKINSLLSAYQGKGFLAYHDAYSYFVRRYGLKQLGVIQKQVGGSMSVRHLVELEQLAKPGEPLCVFREPQFIQVTIPELGRGELKSGTLDPLGIDAANYDQLLESIANQLVNCFG